MIVIGYRLLNDHAALWKLAADCAPLLGTAGELMGLAEDATASALEPWDKLPRRPWPQGRVFGGHGELRWRSYGPTVRVALVADAVTGVIEYPVAAIVAANDILPGIGPVAGVVRLGGELLLIHDLDRFLSLDEEQRLDEALAGR